MKILHLCLASFYIDNFSYQENLLPKYHKKLGYDVEIISSLVSFDKNGKPCLLNKGSSYINENNIPVTRLNFKKSIYNISKIFRQYIDLFKGIKKSSPDIIFIHGCQFVDIKYVVKYLKENPEVKVYVDNHADFSNSATNLLSKYILHRIIWKHCAKIIEPFTTKFYGVLPARVDFLRNVYSLPHEKIELLVMGADDDMVEESSKTIEIKNIREKYNIQLNDFLIVTGGKIDNSKRQILLLMDAVSKIESSNVKLIVFGSVIEEIKDEVERLVDGNKIQYIGWIPSSLSYDYFAIADLAVFPGRHSVFWEQVVGMGIPCIFKFWEGTTHVDVGQNCMFLYQDSVDEIKEKLELIINDPELYNRMKNASKEKGMEIFSYLSISKRSIGLE